jgi:hypothetical protein
VKFSNDANTTYTFTAIGDYNICFDVNASGGGSDYNSSKCPILSVKQAPQNVSCSSTLERYNTDQNARVDFNSFSTTSGTKTYSWLIGGIQVSTDANMVYDFNSAGDKNVCVIVTANSSSKQYCADRFVSEVLVKLPIDEKTGEVLNPFSFTVYTIPGQSFSGRTSDTNFFIYSNDYNLISVKVDGNADYYSRYYLASSGGTYTTIQPYLVRKTDSVLITMYTRYQANLLPYPFVQINAYKVVGSDETLIFSSVTDSKGETVSPFITGDTYLFKFYVSGNYITTMTVVMTGTPLFFYLDTSSYSFGAVAAQNIHIVFTPSGPSRITGTETFKQAVTVTNTTLSMVNVKVTNKGNTLYDHNFTTGVTNGYTNTFYIGDLVPAPDANYAINVMVTAYPTDGNAVTAGTQYYLPVGTDTFQLLKDLKGAYGSSTMLFVSILLTLVICGATSSMLGFFGGRAIVFIAIGIMGFFTLLTWVDSGFYVLLCLAGLVSWVAYGRGE